MPILWCGGEDIDFQYGSFKPNCETLSSMYRTSFSRYALNGAGGLYQAKPFSPAVNDAWISFELYVNSSGVTRTVLRNSINGDGWSIGASSNKLQLSKLISGTTFNTIATTNDSILIYDRIYHLDMHVKINSSGFIKCYCNGDLVIDYSGDTSLIINEVDQCAFIGGTWFALSEFIIADEDTRLMSLKTLAPNAAGDVDEFSGSYTDIDEVTLSDADTIYTATDAQSFQCNLTGMPAGNFIVKAVKVAARATDGVGGMGLKIGIKTNSTVDLSDAITLGGYWETVERMYQQNPVTSNRFSPAEVDALQLAFESAAV